MLVASAAAVALAVLVVGDLTDTLSQGGVLPAPGAAALVEVALVAEVEVAEAQAAAPEVALMEMQVEAVTVERAVEAEGLAVPEAALAGAPVETVAVERVVETEAVVERTSEVQPPDIAKTAPAAAPQPQAMTAQAEAPEPEPMPKPIPGPQQTPASVLRTPEQPAADGAVAAAASATITRPPEPVDSGSAGEESIAAPKGEFRPVVEAPAPGRPQPGGPEPIERVERLEAERDGTRLPLWQLEAALATAVVILAAVAWWLRAIPGPFRRRRREVR